MFETFTKWAHLPRAFKLLVTSRDERLPNSFRRICKRIELPTGSVVTADADDDIQLFLTTHFRQISASYESLGSDWPGKKVVEDLTNIAAGLFVWAETVVRFIERGIADEQLRLILAGDFGDGQDNVSKLYSQILQFHFGLATSSALESFNAVVGSLVLAKVPLLRTDLKYFLGMNMKETSIDYILNKLSSVILIGEDGLIRVGHLSFTEFLLDPKRRPQFVLIDPAMQHQTLGLRCLQLMNHSKDGVKFNICNLVTSHLRNHDIDDLSLRIRTFISSRLLYACRFWADHLRGAKDVIRDRPSVLKQLREFLFVRFLYWLEVLSLTGQVRLALGALPNATQWTGVGVFHYLSMVTASETTW